MKSEGVRDAFKWMKQKCKEQKKVVEREEQNYEKAKRQYKFEDELCLLDAAKIDLERAKERLAAYVDIKIELEKYMKKLMYQGE